MTKFEVHCLNTFLSYVTGAQSLCGLESPQPCSIVQIKLGKIFSHASKRDKGSVQYDLLEYALRLIAAMRNRLFPLR